MSDVGSPESIAEAVAAIVGEQSAAAQALKELAKRRSEGKKAYIRLEKGVWVVGRTLTPKTPRIAL